MIITIGLSPSAAARMRAAAKETERTVEDLAAWAVNEALLDHYKDREDPGIKEKLRS